MIPLNERERLRQELLELHFGCHEAPEALRARIATDPTVRALYDEVRGQAGVLEAAALESVPELSLTDVDAADRRPREGQRTSWFRLPGLKIAASFVLIITVVVPFTTWQVRSRHVDDLSEGTVALVVSGPAGVPDGAPAMFEIKTLNVDQAETPATIVWSARDERGAVLASSSVRSTGTYTLALPPTIDGARLLHVRVDDAVGMTEATVQLTPGRAAPLAHLACDRQLYRGGDVVRYRAVMLDRASLDPIEGAYRFRITDPRGQVVHRWLAGSERGVVAGAWPLPQQAPGGAWNLELRDGKDGFTVEKLRFTVRDTQPPTLAKRIHVAKASYARGTEGAANIEVLRLQSGKAPAAGARVDASLIVDGQEAWTGTVRCDSEGKASIRFPIPDDVTTGDARLVARIDDGGTIESTVATFIVPTGKLDVEFYPEGGEFAAGVPTRIYAEVRDPTGRPTDAKGRIVDTADGSVLALFETRHEGRARVDVTAAEGQRLRLEFDEPVASPVDLPAPVAGAVGLRALADSTPADRPIWVELEAPGPGPWIVGAFCRGKLVAHETRTGAGRRVIGLSPPLSIAGVLRVTVFDRRLRPVAERLVHRSSERELNVAVTPEQTNLPLGGHQKLSFKVTDERGAPVNAVLGVSVHDSAVAAMAGQPRIGLVDRVSLFGDIDPEALEDVEGFVASAENRAEHIDLLLGTRGWRRFAWADADEAVADHGDAARRLLTLEGRAQVPLVIDTRADVASRRARARIGVARAEADEAEGMFRSALFATIAVVLLASCFSSVVRWGGLSRRRRVAAVGTTMALAASLVALVASEPHRSVPSYPGVERAAAADADLDGSSVGTDALGITFDTTTTGIPASTLYDSLLLRLDDEALSASAVQWGTDLTKLYSFAYGANPSDTTRLWAITNGIQQNDQLRTYLGYLPSFEAQPWINLNPSGFGSSAEGLFADLPQLHFGRQLGLSLVDGRLSLPRAPQIVRQYAHKRKRPADGTRQDFTETAYWNATLATNDQGIAMAEFDVGDQLTTWNVAVDAHGSGRVGQVLSSFRTTRPLTIDVKIPEEVTAGDEILLPIAAVTDGIEATSVDVELDVAGAVRVVDDARPVIALAEGRGRTHATVRVDGSGQTSTIGLVANVGDHQDRVRRTLRVAPRGFPRHWSRSGVATESTEFVLPMPASVHEGSLEVTLKMYPSPLATLTDGMRGMLREPHGCFEQTSGSNYPNVLALQFMRSGDGSGMDPKLASRARSYLAKGYQRLIGFEVSGGGFDWYGRAPAHTVLTAYGLVQFHDMSKVHAVDADLIARTRAWLLSQRTGVGGFKHGGGHAFGSAPTEVLDAYVTWTLATTGVSASDIQSELNKVEARAKETSDAYELAVAACALRDAGREDAAEAARSRLAGLQARDGSLMGSTRSVTSSRGRGLAVETTSFAILAWLGSPEEEAVVERAVQWLLGQRQGSGTFGSTQATVMALKALVAYAHAEKPSVTTGDVVLSVNRRTFARRALDPNSGGVMEFPGLENALVSGNNVVSIDVPGGTRIPWALDLRYVSDVPADDPQCPLDLEVELGAARIEEGKSVAIDVLVGNHTDEGHANPIAVLALPSGLHVTESVLTDLKNAGRFAHYEIRGRSLILYWDSIGPNATHTLTIDAIGRIPGKMTGAASRAWLYYEPDHVRWVAPLTVEIAPIR